MIAYKLYLPLPSLRIVQQLERGPASSRVGNLFRHVLSKQNERQGLLLVSGTGNWPELQCSVVMDGAAVHGRSFARGLPCARVLPEAAGIPTQPRDCLHFNACVLKPCVESYCVC